MTENRRPILVDLFAGAGGLSLGFEQAGFDVAAAVEYDPIHAATHELNFPYSTTICSDLTKLSGDDIRKAAGIGRRTIDVVIGGPPCQGFSLIGHRILEDPRNSLVFHFLRLVTELRPRAFMMENVPGMATGDHHQLLDELIERFGDAGYRVRLPYRILNAGHYGVPQDRKRVFILGARSRERIPEYPGPVTFMPHANGGGNGRTSNGDLLLDLADATPGPTVEDAIGDLPDIEGHETLLETDVWKVGLKGGSTYARQLRGDVIDPTDYSYPRDHDRSILTGCQRARHTDESRRRFEATRPGTTEPISRFYRISAGGVCNTLRAGTATDRGAFSAPRPIHFAQPRCISVREAARLHSYPDWFRFHRTIWHGFRQIGNSVPPLLARAVAVSIRDALGVKPSKPKTKYALGADQLVQLNMREASARFGVSATVIAPRRRSVNHASR
jgi:DNA (cytosine-5)-methyltransferase 1